MPAHGRRLDFADVRCRIRPAGRPAAALAAAVRLSRAAHAGGHGGHAGVDRLPRAGAVRTTRTGRAWSRASAPRQAMRRNCAKRSPASTTRALFHGELFESLRWLARYTHAPLGEVLATALPAALRRGEPLPDTHAWAWRLTEEGATRLASLRAGSKPRHFAGLLQAAQPRRGRARRSARRLARRGARAGQARPGRTLRHPGLATRADPAARAAAERRTGARDRDDPAASDRLRAAAARWRHRQRQDRGLPAGDRRLPRARQAGAGAGAGNRPDAADAVAFPRAPRRAGARAAFGLERQRARTRLDRRLARRGAGGGRHALGGVHAAAATPA